MIGQPDENQVLSRQLGRELLQRALDRVQRAQNELDLACADISTILGGVKIWRKSGKVSDQVKAFWYELDRFQGKMEDKGGALADGTTVKAALRRAAADPPQAERAG